MDFENKQNLLFNNLINNYTFLFQQLESNKSQNNNKNFYNIPNLFNNFNNKKNTIINLQKEQNHNLLNKKTLREEENKVKENSKINNKKKIFFIKKITDREKEEAEEKKAKKYIYRGSKYRGVSRNGKTWQVLIMINRNKNYIGNFKSEDDAAKAYDEYAMKFHKNKARLNFSHQGFVKYVNKP